MLTSAIEGAISVVERIDPESKQREAYFNVTSTWPEEEKSVAAESAQQDN